MPPALCTWNQSQQHLVGVEQLERAFLRNARGATQALRSIGECALVLQRADGNSAEKGQHDRQQHEDAHAPYGTRTHGDQAVSRASVASHS